MRKPPLIKIAGDGRTTFLAAGVVLGVGLYGFVATFQPYNTGRVLEPIRVAEPGLVANLAAPLDDLVLSVTEPEAASASILITVPQAPGDVSVILPRTDAAIAGSMTAPRPAIEAAGRDGAVPLAPALPPAPANIAPILIDEAAVLVPVYPSPHRENVLDFVPDDAPAAEQPEANEPTINGAEGGDAKSQKRSK